MITLILSDLHIGDPRTGAIGTKIAKMLSEREFDRLILNGDIFDLWLEDNVFKLQQYVLSKKLLELAHTKQVYWLYGNHDHDTKKMARLLPDVAIANQIDLVDAEQKICVVHGHQVYPFKNQAWYTRWLTKINIWFCKTFDIDLQKKGQKTCCYQSTVRKRRKEIIEEFGKGFNTVISGHTHLVGYCYHNGTQLYDMGSTAFTRTYAEIKDGHIYLRRL